MHFVGDFKFFWAVAQIWPRVFKPYKLVVAAGFMPLFNNWSRIQFMNKLLNLRLEQHAPLWVLFAKTLLI